MMNKIKQRFKTSGPTFVLLSFFIYVTIVLSLIGNFVGISSQYTFYHFGYNSLAIVARFIENTIFSIGWRVFLLGMATMLGCAFMYFLYYHGKKRRTFALIVAYLLYFGDLLLVNNMYYYESSSGRQIATFIHLAVFALALLTLFSTFLRRPLRKGYYDHT